MTATATAPAATEAVQAEPEDRELTRNPYPLFARLREASPVALMTDAAGMPLWFLTRYEDVRAALADPRLRQDARRARELQHRRIGGDNLGVELIHMLNTDPPEHTRLRRLMQGAFSPAHVRGMQPMVERIANRLLDDLAERETTDLVLDFALPLPMTVICELIGFPHSDAHLFRRWSTAILTDAGPEVFAQATEELVEYCGAQIAEMRARPVEGLLSSMIEASAASGVTDDEIIAMIYLLLIGGHETAVNLLSTATLSLLEHPDQLAELSADPGLLPMAVEECLRYESPACMASIRFTEEPVEIGGVEIPTGELVMLSLGAANRDPRRFEDPDRLWLRRDDPGHLAFGHGIHRCLGAALGRMEAQIALGGLVERFPRMELAADPIDLQWRNTTMLRGLESLPIALRG